MSLRSTFVGLALIIALCGASLYLMKSYFGRDAQMRDAERNFLSEHAAGPAISSEASPAWSEAAAGREGTPGQEPLTLDNWYADAGADEGPIDTTPEDKSYLINDAQPLVDTEPS